MKVHKGDLVQVIAGKDRTKRGRVREVLTDKNKVIVEGVNIVTKHTRGQRGARQAGIVQIEAALQASNVMVVCPRCSKAIRISYTFLADGAKVRQCSKCNELLDDPEKRWS